MNTSLYVEMKELDISKISEMDSADGLLIDNVARYLLKDQKGVGELVNGIEAVLEYTAEQGTTLLRQDPELYWQILAEVTSIAQDEKQQEQNTIKKPQLSSGSYRSSGEKGGKRQDESERSSGCHRYRNQKQTRCLRSYCTSIR